jgi:alcohol dehydrogenase class IV
MSLPAGNWSYPTTIWFGNGRINELPVACEQLGIRRPLLVTDQVLATLPIVLDALRILETARLPAALYGDVQGNPTGANVAGGVSVYRGGNHDGVIGFGGGSAMDAAKSIALIAKQERSLWDFEDIGDNWRRADVNAIAPVIAIPTTAGTGSEVGRAAVILDEDARSKKIIFHPRMLPGIVISDPELTVGLPPHITAWTGVDALVHAVEAYCSPGFHPMADGIAIEAIRIISQALSRAVSDGSDLEARGRMLVAASMGATAFQKGLGCIHAIAHTLGALYDIHHGLANAILLPYGLHLNRDAIEERMQHLCTVLALPGSGTSGFIDYTLRLREELSIPHTLAQFDFDSTRAAEIGRLALADPSTAGNARPVTAGDLERMYRAATNGDL